MKDAPTSSPASQIPDHELVAAAKEGREDAFGLLLNKYQTSIYGMVFRHLGHREESEDLVQQVFLKAYQHIKDFRGESKFYTWLYTIALNLIRNHIRQKYTRRTISIDEVGPNDESPARQWAEKGPTPEEEVARRTEIEAIRESLETIGEEQRTSFISHYFQQQSLEEVANRLGRPLGTVKVYLHRARKAIYKAMDENARQKKRKTAQGAGAKSPGKM
jgi:RNA polymerase sigma-70 factor (ECF subfamily)